MHQDDQRVATVGVKKQQLNRVAEVEVPDLVGRQAVHVREDGRVVNEQRDDRRAKRLAVRPDLVVNVGLPEANVRSWHCPQIPELHELLRAWTGHRRTSWIRKRERTTLFARITSAMTRMVRVLLSALSAAV